MRNSGRTYHTFCYYFFTLTLTEKVYSGVKLYTCIFFSDSDYRIAREFLFDQVFKIWVLVIINQQLFHSDKLFVFHSIVILVRLLCPI